MSNMYFHIGLHKTGSTFLQRNVFPYIKGIDNYFATNIGKFKFGNTYSGKTLVSKENLSGMPHKSNDINVRAQRMYRIKMYYPDANIIVMIREKDWKESLYSTYVKGGGTLTYDEWENQIFNYDYADFYYYIKALKANFNRVLVLSYEDFKIDNDYIIRKICDFMGVEFPHNYNRTKIGLSLSNNRLKVVRTLNHLPIKRSNLNRMFDKYIRYKRGQ